MINYSFIYEPGTNNTLIVNFSSKGLKDSDKVVPEFVNTLKPLNCHLAYVLDKDKAWFNLEGTIDGIKNEIKALQKRIKPAKTVFMGISMGGFGAILFSKICKCDIVIAFSPQIDLTVKWDHRYKKFYKKIPKFIVPNVIDYFLDQVKYYIICGAPSLDQQHLALIPEKVNIEKIMVEEADHVPFKTWKRQGILVDWLSKLINPK